MQGLAHGAERRWGPGSWPRCVAQWFCPVRSNNRGPECFLLNTDALCLVCLPPAEKRALVFLMGWKYSLCAGGLPSPAFDSLCCFHARLKAQGLDVAFLSTPFQQKLLQSVLSSESRLSLCVFRMLKAFCV